MKSVFKDIPGYEGYQVNQLGDVKALNYGRMGFEKVMQPNKQKSKNGKYYWRIGLRKNGKTEKRLVHDLVAMTFLSNPNNYQMVNHKDENGLNNNIDNLEWCTNQYNARYSLAKRVGQYKNGKLIKIYEAIAAVKEDGFSREHVRDVCHGKRHSHKGYFWKFIDK